MRRPSLLLLALAALTIPPPAVASPCPDLALVLAVDVSGSVDEREHLLQLKGIADAFRDDAVLAAIESVGTVSLAAVFWADMSMSVDRLGWIDVGTRSDAERFAAAVEAAPRRLTGNTGLGKGLWAALDLLEQRPCARRRLINLSGDGAETVSPRAPAAPAVSPPSRGPLAPHGAPFLRDARQRAEAMGVTINALAIANAEPWLADYFERSVITGPGAFVMEIADYPDFAEAILRKLEREIQPVIGLDQVQERPQFAKLPATAAPPGG